MAYSILDQTGAGDTNLFPVPFPYLKKGDVEVSVGGAVVVPTFPSVGTVRLPFAPAELVGKRIVIRRKTPVSVPASVFAAGGLDQSDLNRAVLQLLYGIQEALDRSPALDDTFRFNGGGHRFANAGDPVDDQDLVTKLWATTSLSTGLGQLLTAVRDSQAARDVALAAASTAASVGDIRPAALYAARGNPAVDAGAIINAYLRSGVTLRVPAGDYWCDSQQNPRLPVVNAISPCIIMQDKLTDCYIVCEPGARFHFTDRITANNPNYYGCGPCFLGVFGDCKRIGWLGGEFVGNRKNLSPSTLNALVLVSSATAFLWVGTRLSGDNTNTSAIAATWMFDSTVAELRGATTIVADTAWIESVTFRDLRVRPAVSGIGAGYSIFTDLPTRNDNRVTKADGTTPRTLSKGISSDVFLQGCDFSRFVTNMYIDGVDGLRTADCLLSGCEAGGNGLVVVTTSYTASLGKYTRNIDHANLTVVGNLGPGVNLNTGGYALGNIRFTGGRNADNGSSDVVLSASGGLGPVDFLGVDFRSTASSSATTPFDIPLLKAIASAGGQIRGCPGVTPTGPNLGLGGPPPAGTGPSNMIRNPWPWPVLCTAWHTGPELSSARYYAAGSTSNAGGYPGPISPQGSGLSIILQPGEGIGFEQRVPSNIVFSGLD